MISAEKTQEFRIDIRVDGSCSPRKPYCEWNLGAQAAAKGHKRRPDMTNMARAIGLND